MNLLGLIFSLLLIVSYSYYACYDKHSSSTRLQKTYTAHQQAYRDILNQFESAWYKDQGSLTPAADENKKDKQSKRREVEEEGEEIATPFNRECARLNLWPLIHEGRENHPALYHLAAKLIRTFYSSLTTEKNFETHFLNLLLASAKAACQKQTPFALEKVVLLDPEWQPLYYKMLKGTKHWDLEQKVGYPPLLDSFKAIPSQDKICLQHANFDMLATLFNEKIAKRLLLQIHGKEKTPPTKELITRISFESNQISLDADLLTLLQYGKGHHPEEKKAFIAKEGDPSLRKTLRVGT